MSKVHRTKEWQRLAKVLRPRIQASLPQPCIGCGVPIQPTEEWDLGHIIDATVRPDLAYTPSNLGPHHRRENRIAGAKKKRKHQPRPERPQW